VRRGSGEALWIDKGVEHPARIFRRQRARAASRLGLSPSALSHAIKGLEGRLGVPLLARTTRSVAPTEAGEELLRTLRPAFEDIEAGLARLGTLRGRPSGTVRLTTFKHAATAVIWPVLPAFLDANPDVRVEVSIDDGLIDIVTGRFDAGIRFGEQVAKDMTAVRVGPDMRAAVVGAPGYFARHAPPVVPQDLQAHRCINYRLPTAGGLFPWELVQDGRPLQVRVDGPLVFNDADLILTAALESQGLAYAWEDVVAEHLRAGRLVRVLKPYSPTFPGFYLYHPSRRQASPALGVLIEALRAQMGVRRETR